MDMHPLQKVSKSEQNRRAYLKRTGPRCPECNKPHSKELVANGFQGVCYVCRTIGRQGEIALSRSVSNKRAYAKRKAAKKLIHASESGSDAPDDPP